MAIGLRVAATQVLVDGELATQSALASHLQPSTPRSADYAGCPLALSSSEAVMTSATPTN
jgi:hypothetical protein